MPLVRRIGRPGLVIVAELQKLGQLKEAGVLDDAEFAAAKAKLLS